jgi:CDP-glycerol glycerophosphotransferase (TagB/SpsB family)
MLEALAKHYNRASNLEWDYEQENIFSLAKANVMISDFSGIIFDYVFLFDKLVMYVNEKIDLRPYDTYDLGEDELWHFKTLREIGIELNEEEFDSIADIIIRATDSVSLMQARHKAKESGWSYQGESGERVADFMIKTANEG